MRKTFALLFTFALTASCTEQDILAPVAPATPNSDVLIVPGMSIGASGSAEATPWYTPASETAGTRAMTRAASYPYMTTNVNGKRSIVVFKDKDGELSSRVFHSRWTQTPNHNANTQPTVGFWTWGTISPCLEVAQKNSGKMQWGTTNAGCTAPWRRPTVGELEEIYPVGKSLDLEEPFDYAGGRYASATEGVSSSEGYHVRFDAANRSTEHVAKTTEVLVRCVRDCIYPYVAPNADGKMSVIVSRDEYGSSPDVALHAPWRQTPYHLGTNVVPVSYSFEVAQTDANSGAKWVSENDYCPAPWRRPTREELVAMVYGGLSLELTTALADKVYWSATTESATGNAVGVYNPGNSGAAGRKYAGWAKNFGSNYLWNTRCVRDVSDNFTATPGSKVATLWGYTNTTGQLADNLIPPTVIKNTINIVDEFELETARYFPADGNKKLYFYAHAPNGVGETVANTNNATVTYTLDGQTDLLWAKDDRGIAKNITPAWQEQPFLQFQHKLMRLAFKVVADPTFSLADSPAVTKITAKGVNTKAVLTVLTGATAFNTPGEVFISPTTSNAIAFAPGTDLTDMLMIQPNPTITLSVVAGGVTYPDITITLTGDGAGTAGMSHLITLTFKQNEIVPAAVIIPWSNTGTGSGDLI